MSQRVTTLLPLAVMLAAGCSSPRYTESFAPEGDITAVVIRSDTGTLELVRGGQLRVQRTIRAPEGALDLSHRVERGASGQETLYLEARCVALLPCSVDTEITIPAGVSVTAELGEGEVWATGIDALTVELDQGSVDAAVTGPLQVQVGSGMVSVDLAAGTTARVAVGRGDITASVTAGPWQLQTSAAHLVVDERIISGSGGGVLELIAPAGRVTVLSTEPVAEVR